MTTFKEFPVRMVSNEEDLRAVFLDYLEKGPTLEEYNNVVSQLEDITDMYCGLEVRVAELEDLLRQNEEEIEKLTEEQEKKPLKRLEKKPLKRLK